MAISLRKLSEEPYASVICYPRPSKAELKTRLRELQRLGIKALEFSGEKKALNVSVLGKGYVGVVTIAYKDVEKVALKIRRVDADRARMQMEAKMLMKANSADVGPRLLDVSNNFLLMQFIEGDLLPEWLKKQQEKVKKRQVLREVLEQCWRLDEAGLDHGELSHAPKHVIVNGNAKPFIVDFETASLNRKPSNVTSICQFLFISGIVAQIIAKRLGERDKNAIIEALRNYKRDDTRENFEKVLVASNL